MPARSTASVRSAMSLTESTPDSRPLCSPRRSLLCIAPSSSAVFRGMRRRKKDGEWSPGRTVSVASGLSMISYGTGMRTPK